MHIKTSNQPELKLGIGDYTCNWGVHICGLYEKYYSKFPQCDCHVDMPEHFSVLNAKDLYYPNGVFSPIEMDKGLNNFFKLSQKNGKKNVRATAEMAWAL